MNNVKVSIVILTFNGLGEHLSETVEAIYKQKYSFPFEVIAIDSGSTDRTVEFIKKNPQIRLKQIPKSEFSHGKTRRLGAEMTKGELVVFLTQDATPANSHWLSELVKDFKDPETVGVCGQVLARKEACLLKKIEVRNDLSGRDKKIVAQIKDKNAFKKLSFHEKRVNYYFFNDVSSCVRRDYYLKKPVIDVAFAEDVEFAKMALADGKKIIFEPKSLVFHSHEYTPIKSYKRNLTDSRYHKEELGVSNVPTLKHLLKNVGWQIKRDFNDLDNYNANSLEKVGAILYSPVIHFAEQLGQYRGTK